eukprot:g45286.t1
MRKNMKQKMSRLENLPLYPFQQQFPLLPQVLFPYKVSYNREMGECKLEISMTFADDAGEYSVVVRNKHGEISASTQLLEEADYELYMKEHEEITERTEIVTEYVQEPKVAEVAPTIFMTEYEKEQALIRKKMGKSAAMMKTVTEEQ